MRAPAAVWIVWVLLAPPARAEDVSPSVLASLGVATAIDGVRSNGQLGAVARLGVDLGPVEIALEAHGGGPDVVRTPGLDFHLARGLFRLGALVDLFDDGEWRLPIGVALGLSGWARISSAFDPALVPTDGGASGAFTIGIEARVMWLPSFLGRIVGLDLALGADVMTPQPRYVVDEGASLRELVTLWPISPRASLAIVVRARP